MHKLKIGEIPLDKNDIGKDDVEEDEDDSYGDMDGE